MVTRLRWMVLIVTMIAMVIVLRLACPSLCYQRHVHIIPLTKAVTRISFLGVFWGGGSAAGVGLWNGGSEAPPRQPGLCGSAVL